MIPTSSVHRASAKGLDFDTVVIADAESDSATDPTAATLRMAYYVMITRARRRLVLGWAGHPAAVAPGGAARVGADAVTA
ncbi:ATP-binding domain-containing protein [Streptomyces brevispora]|uniref:ATP-binding domain-containing protein n=1 Tax=Streptomyces brevispora TaxID=887462 RepID=UPI0033DCBB1B